jgi:drug/metabolite transporter (DMT)-like permease
MRRRIILEGYMTGRQWFIFGVLGAVWGSSFFWIKIALVETGPFTLVGWRLLFGVLGMIVVILLTRPAFPRQPQVYLNLIILGLTNTAVPFVLITWGEVSIDSAIASILNSTVPLFTLVIAHLFLQDDRITLPRVAGLLTGFAGVVLLLSRNLGPQGADQGLLGQGAVLAASLSYAASGVFARRTLRQVSPYVQAFVPLLVADLFVWSAALALETPASLPRLPLTWLALIWLGLLGSCLAYVIYFTLLHSVGPTKATMVTYLLPLVGVALGVGFLQEQFDFRLAAGCLLVIGGIAVVNRPAG